MRKLLFLIALCLLVPSLSRATCDSGQSSTTPFSVGGTYTVVQFCAYSPTSGGDTNRAQYLQALAAGNLSVFIGKQCQSASCNSPHPAALTASDNINGSYTCPANATLLSPDADNAQSICWFCNTAASAVTVSILNGATWISTALFEVHSSTGACNGLILDTHGPTASSFPAATTTPSISTLSATANANELIINQMFFCPNTVTTTATGIFTKVSQYGNGTFACGLAVEMGNVASAGTTATSNWTVSPSSSTNGVVITLTPFSPASGHSYPMVIKFRLDYRIPAWDNRKHKLQIVSI